MPVFSITANSLSNVFQFIIKTKKLCEQPYDYLLNFFLIHTGGQLTNLSSHQLKNKIKSVPMINTFFSNYLNLNFPNFVIIDTKVSV